MLYLTRAFFCCCWTFFLLRAQFSRERQGQVLNSIYSHISNFYTFLYFFKVNCWRWCDKIRDTFCHFSSKSFFFSLRLTLSTYLSVLVLSTRTYCSCRAQLNSFNPTPICCVCESCRNHVKFQNFHFNTFTWNRSTHQNTESCREIDWTEEKEEACRRE